MLQRIVSEPTCLFSLFILIHLLLCDWHFDFLISIFIWIAAFFKKNIIVAYRSGSAIVKAVAEKCNSFFRNIYDPDDYQEELPDEQLGPIAE